MHSPTPPATIYAPEDAPHTEQGIKRVLVIVLDSVGIGAAPDAEAYGDVGSATLPHLAQAAGGLDAPTFSALGLGNIPYLVPQGIPIEGVPPQENPAASFGAMQEVSQGKDTITGHWEIGGLEMNPGFALFPKGPPSFPVEIIRELTRQTGLEVIGNRHASGTAIIEELGKEHFQKKALIVYTSVDSVFQVAAHIDVISQEELYGACKIARKLCDPYKVGRVIARPFQGKHGSFERTNGRRDFAYKPTSPTILERLHDHGIPVYTVGKIADIYAHRGINESIHSGNNLDSQKALDSLLRERKEGLLFANFIDFDMLWGHRRDPIGYARALEQTDGYLATLLPKLTKRDVLILTADHGNDPTFKGTDHTREFVPLLVYRAGEPARGTWDPRRLFDVAQSLATYFGLPPTPKGKSFA